MKKLLIVNADDFGMATGVTDAIIDCHKKGIITSTTLMVNMPDVERAAELAKPLEKLGVGIHLNLTEGRPLTDPALLPDLVDENGKFFPNRIQSKNLWFGQHVRKQVLTEYRAQIKRAFDLGVEPTHCDSHHGSHRMPVARSALIEAVQSLAVPRVRYQLGYDWLGKRPTLSQRRNWAISRTRNLHRILAHRLNRELYRRADVRTNDQKLDFRCLIGAPDDPKQAFFAALEALPEGVTEFVFHPAYPDSAIKEKPSTTEIRRIDTLLAADEAVRQRITELGIPLGSFADL